MLKGQNIVCFAKDWSDHPTSVTHVMMQLARHNRVLWLDSIGSRRPDLTSGRDIRKIFRKLATFTKGPRQVRDNLWVYSPVALPLPHNPLAVWLNAQILRRSLDIVRRRLGMHEFQLWSFYPTPGAYVGKLGESLAVYYMTDAWAHFEGMDKDGMTRANDRFVRIADVVFATANSLVEQHRPINPEIHLASHGVGYEHFAKSLDESTPLAADIANLPRPIIGFFGLLHHWIDQALILKLAERHEDWSIVLVGHSDCDVSRLEACSNIHVLGGRDYATLPQYCRGFDVGIIPFEVSELTHHVNPIKLREYLAAGLPVVSTALPEVTHYADLCTVAYTHAEFIAGVEAAVASDSLDKRMQRSDSMKTERWQDTVARVGEHVARVQRAKAASRR
jgi:glycosyltransferase involved in cell wall biosynthesis